MYVFATQRKWSTLLGVFSTKEKALVFWDSLSPYQREIVESIEVCGLGYDFVLVEYQDYAHGVNAFEYYSYEDYSKAFTPPEDGAYFEVYYFECDWNSSMEDLHPCDGGVLA